MIRSKPDRNAVTVYIPESTLVAEVESALITAKDAGERYNRSISDLLRIHASAKSDPNRIAVRITSRLLNVMDQQRISAR